MSAYRSLVRQVKPVQKQVKTWLAGAISALRDCFKCTDWCMSMEVATDGDTIKLEEYTVSVICYINTCIDDNPKNPTEFGCYGHLCALRKTDLRLLHHCIDGEGQSGLTALNQTEPKDDTCYGNGINNIKFNSIHNCIVKKNLEVKFITVNIFFFKDCIQKLHEAKQKQTGTVKNLYKYNRSFQVSRSIENRAFDSMSLKVTDGVDFEEDNR
ncbi:hypothetical protein chiPu_0000578 [Chiloscyllium punctatum]|uniref:Uncharacterized protein n=1 Tax=Chiloscyllium punctatum TaxID=137246 RepID=A0A401RVP6_CHIPU|nr:hypothetical protein [Chiloscyllium punctatum]